MINYAKIVLFLLSTVTTTVFSQTDSATMDFFKSKRFGLQNTFKITSSKFDTTNFELLRITDSDTWLGQDVNNYIVLYQTGKTSIHGDTAKVIKMLFNNMTQIRIENSLLKNKLWFYETHFGRIVGGDPFEKCVQLTSPTVPFVNCKKAFKKKIIKRL